MEPSDQMVINQEKQIASLYMIQFDIQDLKVGHNRPTSLYRRHTTQFKKPKTGSKLLY